jgi:parallel beta-helix repeat protein
MILLLFIVIINSASLGSIQLQTILEDKQLTHQMTENFDSPSFEAETSGKENIGIKTPEIENLSLLKVSSIEALAYISSIEINIVGNAQFHSEASSNGWDVDGRDGTAQKPYLINNTEVIPSSNSIPAIRIEDTDLYFVISNCLLRNGSHGLEFLNVTHGLVYNNIIKNNTNEGVKLYQNSINNSLTHNTVHNNTGEGIDVWNSGNNTLSHNIVYENGEEGIQVEYSYNCTVSNNICYNNSLSSWTWDTPGIRFYNCSYSTLENNTVFNESNDGGGIKIEDSPNCTIYNITVSNNEERGFSANNCSFSIFNEIKSYNNDREGIAIWYSQNSSFTNFKCINNSERGINIYYSGNSTFTNLVCTNNSYGGIYIEDSGNSEIEDILCENNGESGLKLSYSNYSTLINIAVSKNSNGLYMEQTHYCTLYNITSSFNRDRGINFQYCSNSVMLGSNIFNNSYHGMEFYDSSFNKINNNHIYNNNDYGIYFGYSGNIIFSGNSIYKNTGAGIYHTQSNYSQVVSNAIYDNFGNGISLSDSFGGNISFNTIYRNGYKGISCSSYSENGGGPSTIITKNDLIYNNWDEIQIFYQIRLEGGSNIINVFNVNHNFYDTYRTPDEDNDGLVDYPYVIGDYWDEKQYYFYDDYPETEPINPATIHYLSTPLILSPTRWDPAIEWDPEPEKYYEDEPINGTVTIELLAPIDSEGHSITYSLYYTSEWGWEWDLQDWIQIASGITTIIYDWDTKTVLDGDYSLAVVATCSEGLNSTFIDTDRIQINNSPPELTNLVSSSTVGLILTAFVVIMLIQRKKKRVRK